MKPTTYNEFLASKCQAARKSGFRVPLTDIHPLLFDWQRLIVQWALLQGRAALFEDPGMGKTLQQLEWARHVQCFTGKPVLVVAPLAVAHQTVREGKKLDLTVVYARSQMQAEESGAPVVITNYEMIEHFDARSFSGVVLDESSILKSFTGTTKRMLIEMFGATQYRLACTATPSPNDHLELGNHAEFLGVMQSNRMISRWFVNDSMQAGGYRLKHHAREDFWRWVVSWAVAMRRPSDMGSQFSNEGFILPDLKIIEHFVQVDHSKAWDDGQLLRTTALSATGMWRDKRSTAADRVEMASEIVGGSDDYWVLWCDTNDEADLLQEAFPQAVEVRGNHSVAEKERKLRSFSDGEAQIIITKPDIAGFGLNWQHANHQIFVGMTYSFEKVYQAMRRLWRFGQKRPVNTHMIYAETENGIRSVLQEKERLHDEMMDEMTAAMLQYGLDGVLRTTALDMPIQEKDARGETYRLMLGDTAQRIREIADQSIDFQVHSPPFSTLYIYSDRPEDLGNNADHEAFFEHYAFIISEQYRIAKPGTLMAVHCKDLPLYMNRDGAAGLYDFPGRIVRAHEAAGWQLYQWHTIWKDPVIEMQRTKNHGLLWKNFSVRGEVVRQGMADYVLTFRRPVGGEHLTPVAGNRGNRLNHDVIDRAIHLWTNPGDFVISPINTGRERIFDSTLDGKAIDFAFFNGPEECYDEIFLSQLAERIKPGRLVAVLTRRQYYTNQTGNIVALRDVPGRIIEAFDRHGLTFHSRVAIPDGSTLLLFRRWINLTEMPDKQVHNAPKPPRDRTAQHPDYVGTNPPEHWSSDRDYSIQLWQKYASPVWNDLGGLGHDDPTIWYDIDQTNVLNHRIARGNKDEKHICPLQLGLIARLIRMYSSPNDLIFSPFAGVGSEGVETIKAGRRFIGCELKPEYWQLACKHLEEAELENNQIDLFTWAAMEQEEVHV